MPRRTIAIGNQPSSFQFQDDFGPLNNGLAYAAGQWLASGRDRAQIEMQRDAQAQQAEEREQDVGFRTQDMELRRLALSQQDQQRKDALDERKIYHSDQATRYADERKQRKARDDAEAGATLRDDFGATGKYFLDWFRGGNPANVPRGGAGSSASADLSREKFNREKAIQEIGSPDYNLEVVEDPVTGQPRQIHRPLTEQERASRIDRINARENELNGHPFVPVPGFHADTGIIAPAQTAPAGSLSETALGAPKKLVTPISKEGATAAKVDPARFNDAVTRANKALMGSMPGQEKPGMVTITNEQRTRLAKTIADAQQGNPAAVQALMRWHDGQADTKERDKDDKLVSDALSAGGNAMMMGPY